MAPPDQNPSPPPARRFDAVVFDAYGTLFDVNSVASLAEQLYRGQGEALAGLWRRKQLEYSWLRALSGRYRPFLEITRDALRHSVRALGITMDEAAEAKLMGQYACLSVFPENLAALREMKAAGLALAVLTNGDPEMIAVSLRSGGMTTLFDTVLSADQAKSFKTSDAVYALGPAAFGCEARRILFVSSNCWDAIGARWHGYTSFWINRQGAPLEELGTEPDFTGTLLTDVLSVARGQRTAPIN
jgi:2-haloacid dehalogenase